MTSAPVLPDGYSDVPPGMLANVVTCLQMLQRPRPKPARPLERPLTLERIEKPALTDYRALFRAVGEDWLWSSRLVMPDAELAAILQHPDVEVYVLGGGKQRLGLLELDFRQRGECELAFFGLVPQAIGQGAGRFLMDQALAKAWARPIERLWVHTCTFDHPGALGFYRRSGFVPFAFQVEVQADPRLSGHLPRGAAPHVPLADFSA
ncbi:GNAT family N-acetyltransferase [Labrys okinawensis]|uniref:GNAT family N-acetyltransferase n=1 Tax=Labrys okinawensis TaxID=346911 RepID=A0A2S9Q9A2_9HYPH|nr:GNAT family N-acetyltransferase [Labrys okinawensis]PRH85927.1 GNAT family N-acetyltransferase [Labrys okinawensis]